MEAKYWTHPANSIKITEGKKTVNTPYRHTQTAARVNTE